MAGRSDSGENLRIIEEHRESLAKAYVPNLGLETGADPQTFSDALALMKSENIEGAAVDAKSVEELAGSVLILDKDGTAGSAVRPDGYYTAVFKNGKRNNAKLAIRDITMTAVANGATHGDCYGIFLVNGYATCGFEPVSRVNYVRGLNPEMDAYVSSTLPRGERPWTQPI